MDQRLQVKLFGISNDVKIYHKIECPNPIILEGKMNRYQMLIGHLENKTLLMNLLMGMLDIKLNLSWI